MKRLLPIVGVAVLVLAFHVQSATAAAIVYGNRVAFDAAFPGANIENWDGFANGAVITNGSTVAGITYNSSSGSALVTNSFLVTTIPNGLGNTTNGFFAAGDSMTFSFAQPIDVFGIDINTFDPGNGGYSALTNTGELITSFFDPFPGFGTGQFLGFQAMSPFTSVTISGPGGFSYTLDTLRSFRTPEPASMLAWGLLTGVGLVGYRLRRRKVAA